MKSSEFEISFSVESYDKKTTGKWPTFLRCRKARSNALFSNVEIKYMDQAIIERHGRARQGQFIVLNDPSSPKKIMKMYVNIFPFFKSFRTA